MADVPPDNNVIDLLINGSPPQNKISYVKSHAIAENQVVYSLDIRTGILFTWESLNHPERNYVDLLNAIIPGEVVRVKRDSTRVTKRLQQECQRSRQKLKLLNRTASKKKRESFLNGHTTLSLLMSDIVTAAEWEGENKRLLQEVDQLMEKVDDLNSGMEKWRREYTALEEEKVKLYEGMVKEFSRISEDMQKDMSGLTARNLDLRKHIQKLEREQNEDLKPFTKDLADLSSRQRARSRLKELSSRAQKALWFTELFGLRLESLQVSAKGGQSYNVSPSPSQSTSIPSPDVSSIPSSPDVSSIPSTQSTSSSPVALNRLASQQDTPNVTPAVSHNFKQYKKLSHEDKS